MTETTQETVDAFHRYLDQMMMRVGSGEIEPFNAGRDVGMMLKAWVDGDPDLHDFLDLDNH